MENPETTQYNISEDEQTELLELNAEYQNLLLALGELQVEELSLDNELRIVKETKDKYKESLIQFKNKEKLFLERLTKKYGDGSLDTSSGVYLKR
tara:strand:- start:1707 stop:1991 length:285 start_codon:yes stop_codon:yes gene_type:complete